MIGTILSKRDAKEILQKTPGASTWIKENTNYIFEIKWKKGGTEFNVCDIDVDYIS
jgi:hypothetical protein